ncbi:dephospho-CoA kinase [Limoniibacter endophyticus]|uniref:Dephospho-CoA kinase n=1 Tax=Limoniibacter endophyticus TaxID=1565040 RepID=A0A8J3DJU3_9HYPH|nr:dephospho-CoA kinase [Limoniibacter endophyticus]GHC74411.1 dephospho-CoA kinase [Limoniibacter endophyticus]
MIILALTGSIGMGKSTTAKIFSDQGVPVHDSDMTVHEIYAGEAVPFIEEAFPGAVKRGMVDRSELGALVLNNPGAIKRLESIVHPLVRSHRDRFLKYHKDQNTSAVLLDVPLLFETGADAEADKIVVVTCDPALQRERVLTRPGMTLEKFEAIVARQMPDAEKRARADFVIDTGNGLDDARHQVQAVLHSLGIIT